MGGYSVSYRNANGKLVSRNFDYDSWFFKGIYSAKEMAEEVKKLLEDRGYAEVTIRDRGKTTASYNSYTPVSRKARENTWKERLGIA